MLDARLVPVFSKKYCNAEYNILMRRHTFLLFFKQMALIALHITFLSFSLSTKLPSSVLMNDVTAVSVLSV
jgi:hypothetical protein